MRREAGQHAQVQAFLAGFPDEGVATETLLQVSELQTEYQQNSEQIRLLQQTAARLTAAVSDPQWREQAEAIRRRDRAGTELQFAGSPGRYPAVGR